MEQLLSFAIYLMTITGITFMLAVSLDLQIGGCGLVNFGQVVFLAVGAYTTAIAISWGAGPAPAVAYSVLASAVFGVLMSIEPAMAALAAFVILGERLAPRQLAGIVLVCLASAGATLTRRRPEVSRPTA